MFEALGDRLAAALKKISGRGVLRPEDVEAGLREVRLALLEADVNFKVVKEFVDRVRARLVGVEMAPGLTAPQQVVKAVNQELVELLGGNAEGLRYSPAPPTVLMLVGLQGSGKTTTSVKLALLARREGHKPMLVALDLRRPAAVEQLKALAEREQIAFHSGQGAVEEIARAALKEASRLGHDVVILDTAGRLHIDDELMNELSTLKKELQPAEILFIADAMIGQDAVRSAGEFHKRLGLTGVILTKLDGDARGGAALSIAKVSGAPVKFVGLGEKYDALEGFYPERIVSRVLGMGDIMSLIERAEQAVDKKAAMELERKLRKNEFTLEDFRDQLKQVRKMGPLEQVVDMLPKIGPLANLPKDAKVDESMLKRVEAIINSMTNQERRDHNVIDGKRRKRIANGSGTSVQEVNQVLKQYMQMRQMMKQYGAMAARAKMKGLGKLAGLG